MTGMQHLQALELANRVRLARAELKRAVKAGDVAVAEILLAEIPDWLERMLFEELCRSIPHFTTRHFQRLLSVAGARRSVQIGALTTRQRRLLGECLAGWERIGGTKRRRADLRRELWHDSEAGRVA